MGPVVHFWDTHTPNGQSVPLSASKIILQRYADCCGVEVTFVPSCYPAFSDCTLPAAFFESDIWTFDALFNRLCRQKPLEQSKECEAWCPLALIFLTEALEDALWHHNGDYSTKNIVHATLPNRILAYSVMRDLKKLRRRRSGEHSGLAQLEELIRIRKMEPFIYGSSPSALDVILSAFGYCFKQLGNNVEWRGSDELRALLAEADEAYSTYFQQHSIKSPRTLLPLEDPARAEEVVAEPDKSEITHKASPGATWTFVLVGGVVALFVARIFKNS